MKNKFFRGISIVLSLLAMFSLVACKSNDSSVPTETSTETSTETVKLTWYRPYANEPEKIVADYAIAELKKEMPNVEIEIMPNPQDSDQKIKTMAASEDLPDIMTLNPTLVDLFNKSESLMVLDQVVEDMGVFDQVQEGSKSLLIQGDHTYGIPEENSNYILLFYNKEAFAGAGVAIPTNYEEFLAAVQDLQAKGITPVSFFSKELWPSFSFYDALVSRTEPTGLKRIDAGAGEITEPAYLEAAKKFYELAQAGVASKAAFTTAYDEAQSLFTTGKAAMLLNGSWALTDLGSAMGDNIGLLPLSILADAENVESSMGAIAGGGPSNIVTACAYSKNKDIAAKAAVILGLKTVEGKIVKGFESNTFFKADIESETSPNALQLEFATSVVPNVKTFTSFYWGLSNTIIQTTLGENIQKLMLGSPDYTPEQFIEETDKTIKASN